MFVSPPHFLCIIIGPVLPFFQIPFNYIKLQNSCTLTSDVWIGEEFWCNGVWNIEIVEVGENSLIGDTGALANGSFPNNSIIGCLSVVDQAANTEIRDNFSVTLGNRATWTRYSASNNKVSSVRESNFANGYLRPILDILMLLLTIFLSENKTLLILIPSAILSQSENTFLTFFQVTLISKLASMAIGYLLAIILKYGLIGTYANDSANDMYSFFLYRLDFTRKFVSALLDKDLCYFNSSEMMNILMRSFGWKIGNQVIIDFPGSFSDFDLIQVDDDCVIEQGVILQAHTYERRVLQVKNLIVNKSVVISSHSVILGGSYIEENVFIESMTLIMKVCVSA